YASQWGHRGFTHSLLFAAVVALAISRRRFVRYFIVLASHGLLDAMTTGGLGAALLWPFSDARYFLPWRPIPVAPLGMRILSTDGLQLMLFEALLFSPFWLFALARAVLAKRP